MKKFRFVVETGFVNCTHEVEEEFEDDVTEEELDGFAEELMRDYIHTYYEEVED